MYHIYRLCIYKGCQNGQYKDELGNKYVFSKIYPAICLVHIILHIKYTVYLLHYQLNKHILTHIYTSNITLIDSTFTRGWVQKEGKA